uniref:Uncharacterized protein n=1 Tax=Marseillevirus LCMAC201 TaxID=2506605 RepID=A0A481YY37_9VIRU|nr:MAG: hypothetical protein LCMAC201_03640 [Marseillevirus LCMAC201]
MTEQQRMINQNEVSPTRMMVRELQVDNGNSEEVGIYVVMNSGSKAVVSMRELRAYVNERLPKDMDCEEIVQLDRLPLPKDMDCEEIVQLDRLPLTPDSNVISILVRPIRYPPLHVFHSADLMDNWILSQNSYSK